MLSLLGRLLDVQRFCANGPDFGGDGERRTVRHSPVRSCTPIHLPDQWKFHWLPVFGRRLVVHLLDAIGGFQVENISAGVGNRYVLRCAICADIKTDNDMYFSLH